MMRSNRLFQKTFAVAVSIALLPLTSLPAAALAARTPKKLKDSSLRPVPLRTGAKGWFNRMPAPAAAATLQNAQQLMTAPGAAPDAGKQVYDQAAPRSGDASAVSGSADGLAINPSGLQPAPPPAASGPLERAAEPKKYAITTELDPDADKFTAKGVIDFKMLEKRDSVTLHASPDLSIKAITFNKGDGAWTTIAVKDLKVDKTNERITIPLPESHIGDAQLYIEVESAFNKQMKGVYVTKDKWKRKEEKYVATQFEATDARKHFPVWDEPSYKAVWEQTIISPAWHTVVGNMLPKSEEVVDGKKITVFHPTPRMSSYLLAFFSGRFDYIEGRSKKGVRVRVYGHPSKIKKMGRRALEGQLKFIDWGSEYYGVEFDSFLQKHDMIGLVDFAAGAMENPGANSFRETALFFDQDAGTMDALERVLVVVSHENTHTWFGDLVTMRWWNGLWLNEAFANYMAYKTVDAFYPALNVWKGHEEAKQKSMKTDALKNSRPVQVAVKTEPEIRGIFDDITYQKGGAVLGMIENYITLPGRPAYRDGIRSYMKKHAYGNAELDDLLTAFSEASKNPRINEIGTKWVTQAGFPIVEIKSQGGMKLKLAQRRFMADGEPEQGAKTLWPIPLVLKYQLAGESTVRTHRVLFDRREAVAELPGKGRILWINANGDQSGYYRVGLSGKLQDGLLDRGLKRQSALERIGIVSDLWARTQAGELTAGRYLEALSRFKGEEDRSVLATIADSLVQLDETFIDTPEEKAVMRAFVKDLVGGQWKKWGWPKKGEDHEIARSRAIVLALLGRFAPDAQMLKEARARLDRYLDDPTSGDPNISGALLMIGARHGDQKLWDKIFNLYRTTKTPDLKVRLLAGGLAEFSDPALVDRTLSLMFAKNGKMDVIRGQDLMFPLAVMLGRKHADPAAYDFITRNWKELMKKGPDSLAGRLIAPLASIRYADRVEHMKSFFMAEENRKKDADRVFHQTIEKIGYAVKFKAAHERSMREWLKERGAE